MRQWRAALVGSLGVSPSRFAERSGSLGASPSRFAERSLRHPGFAHSCILAFALRASLDCKAGSFGPGSPLAYGFMAGLSAAGAAVCGRGRGRGPSRVEAGRVRSRSPSLTKGAAQAGRVFGCRRHLGCAEAASRPEDPSRFLLCPPQERRPAAGGGDEGRAGWRRGGCGPVPLH